AHEGGSGDFFVSTIRCAGTPLGLHLGPTPYHPWPQTRAKRGLQAFAHAAILLLIAGTYTPFTLGPLRGVWGWSILGLIWALAIFGIIMKATRGASRHPKLGLALYLGMGWLPLIVIGPLALAIPPSALFWLVAGGIAYTTGV